MKTTVSKTAFLKAEVRMEDLLRKAAECGGFDALKAGEKKELSELTAIVQDYEAMHYTIPAPETLRGLLELKMYERKLKQKELAALLQTSTTQLSEIMHEKRKPTLAFLKALHKVLGIDGNVLLRLV